MRRGEVWWATMPEPIGTRPVLLLSRDKAIQVRERVTVAFVTTKERGIRAEVRLGMADGMPKDCVVNTDLINTIPKTQLRERICALSNGKMSEVSLAVRFALSL